MTHPETAGDRKDRVWQQRELATKFTEGIRGGVPLAAEQLDVMLRVIAASGTTVERFLDLGCGDGILGRTLLEHFPQSRGVFLDFSEAMIEAARAKCAAGAGRCRFVNADFGAADWTGTVAADAPFDLIVSGFAIHHQTDERKGELYGEVWQLLRPGGLFLNLEHVASRSAWGAKAFEEAMVDSLWKFHRQRDPQRTRESVAQEYVNRPDWSANILAPVEDQCAWLRTLGFVDVDCFFKLFELALFGGSRKS
jgi:SAM-dependent methyltransferase